MTRLPRVRRALAAVAAVAALLAGVLVSGAAQSASAAGAQPVPSWLTPMETANYHTGAYRQCTAIKLSLYRALTSPDCFTGRTVNDNTRSYWDGRLSGGSPEPVFTKHPQYDPKTRAAAFAVAEFPVPKVSYTTGSGTPVLASTADAKLYSPGATATFYSWVGPAGRDAQRKPHNEQVAILSVATCAKELGRTPAAGTFCTLPAKGAPVPSHADQCVGDAGGALVAGGKLIGISATSGIACVAASGVRVYTNVTAYRGEILGWARDRDVDWAAMSGSVTARTDLGGWSEYSFCYLDGGRHLTGCGPGGGFTDHNVQINYVTQAGDLDGDGYGDLLIRTPGGGLFAYPNLAADTARYLGGNFNRYTSLVATRDLSGDGYPDVVARDGSGNLWLYRGTSAGTLSARTLLGKGWNAYNLVTGRGDLSGDGRTDLVARDKSGTLWLYRGTGKGGLAARTKMATGFGGYKEIVASGDMDNNGYGDLFGRTPGGGVFLINANNRGGLSTPKLYAYTYYKPFTQIS
jgi:hypothetical protein